MYNTIDYQNALWGKDIYTPTGLLVRAEILEKYCPDIHRATENLLNILYEIPKITEEDILNLNQREFSLWLYNIFYILKKAYDLVKTYTSHEKDSLPIAKLGERDIYRTALLGCYKNQTDEDFYNTIDNVIFITIDLSLGFPISESELGILSKYIKKHIKKFENIDLKIIFEKLQKVVPEIILDTDYSNESIKKDIFFKVVDGITFLKED